MGKKPKARGHTRTAEKPEVATPDDKAQFERFVETARMKGVDESNRGFDAAFDKIDAVKRSPK